MGLRIHVVSDLHADGYAALHQVPCDLIVIAGDLANGPDVPAALSHLARQVQVPVVFVPGNHDWYASDLFRDHDHLIGLWESQGTARVLSDRSWTISLAGQTYRFIGSTWWTAMDWTPSGNFGKAAMEEVGTAVSARSQGIDDFAFITWDGRRLHPDDLRRLHHRSTAWITAEVATAETRGETPIVVTHTAPSRVSLGERYQGDPFAAYYANQADSATTGVPLWIHGHIHRASDYILPSGCRVVCNPKGYNHGSDGYQPSLIVEIS